MQLKFPVEKLYFKGDLFVIPVMDHVHEFRGAARLNCTAEYFVDLLKKEISEEEIIRDMEEKYDAPREVIAADVRKHVKMLQEGGMLTA